MTQWRIKQEIGMRLNKRTKEEKKIEMKAKIMFFNKNNNKKRHRIKM